MSFLDQITVLVLTYNEEANIGRTLDALVGFSDVIVLDSGSTDATSDIVSRYRNTNLVTRSFDTHANQWNYGLSLCKRQWVLVLDADYILPASITRFVGMMRPDDSTAGYSIRFRYCIFGRALSASLYPPLVVLFRRAKATFVQEGHTQRVAVVGKIETLPYSIDHDDRKPITRWFSSQANYAKLEAAHLLTAPEKELTRAGRFRRLGWPAPILVTFYVLFVKGCVLDGWAGWFYALQRLLAETMIALEVIDCRLRERARRHSAGQRF